MLNVDEDVIYCHIFRPKSVKYNRREYIPIRGEEEKKNRKKVSDLILHLYSCREASRIGLASRSHTPLCPLYFMFDSQYSCEIKKLA